MGSPDRVGDTLPHHTRGNQQNPGGYLRAATVATASPAGTHPRLLRREWIAETRCPKKSTRVPLPD